MLLLLYIKTILIEWHTTTLKNNVITDSSTVCFDVNDQSRSARNSRRLQAVWLVLGSPISAFTLCLILSNWCSFSWHNVCLFLFFLFSPSSLPHSFSPAQAGPSAPSSSPLQATFHGNPGPVQQHRRQSECNTLQSDLHSTARDTAWNLSYFDIVKALALLYRFLYIKKNKSNFHIVFLLLKNWLMFCY